MTIVRFVPATRVAGFEGTRTEASLGFDFPGGATGRALRCGVATGATAGVAGFATTTCVPWGVGIDVFAGGRGTSAERTWPGLDLIISGSADTACRNRVPDVRAKSMTNLLGLSAVAGSANAW